MLFTTNDPLGDYQTRIFTTKVIIIIITTTIMTYIYDVKKL